MRILVVEDEPNLNDALCRMLAREQYAVDSCLNGLDAKDYIEAVAYDAIVLDVMLPGMDGLSLLRWLRAGGRADPVLLLTARDSVEHRVQGLDAGADDYLTKPFAFEELLARIRVLVRKKAGGRTSRLAVADLELDTAARQVFRGGQELFLSGREYALLEYLMRNQGIILSRQRIEDHIWNLEYEGGSNIVDVYIRKLRRIVDEGREPKLIHTVRGMGYVLRVQP